MNRHGTWTFVGIAAIALAVLGLGSGEASAATKKCFYVSSYHRGYEHSDQIEHGIRSVLTGKCEIRQFDMDTKRQKAEDQIKRQALAAKAIIDSWQPDVVITSDDNAAKYLIQPYYKDHKLPFVFCGLNWTAKEYGFPYSNATGMIEVAPIIPMLERAMRIVPAVRRAFYIGAEVLSEEKNLKRFQQAAVQLGFKLEYALAKTTDAWVAAYERAQDYDLVIVGNSVGISNWDRDKAKAAILRTTRKLTVTNHGWMMPYAILGVTKVSEEQGVWAAKAALDILNGLPPSRIPIVPNTQRDIWINTDILAAARMTLPQGLMRKGKKVAGLEPKN